MRGESLTSRWSGRSSRNRFSGAGAESRDGVLRAVVVGVLSAAALGSTAAAGAPLTVLQWLVLSALTLDMAGGIVGHAMAPAGVRSPGVGPTRSEHLAFVGLHALHLALFTAVLGGMTWRGCTLFYGLMMGSGTVLLHVPARYHRLAAISLNAGLMVLSLTVVSPATGLAWVLPLLFLKLASRWMHEGGDP